MPSLNSARHSHPKKGRWHVVQSLFFIFVFSLAAFFFLQSPFFSIKDINVAGNKRLKTEEIVSLTGITKGLNIFKANLREAREKIELNPMVKETVVTRDFPSTVLIKVYERTPVGLIPNQGSFVVVSDDGYYLSREKNLSNVNLPIVTGVTLDKSGPGQNISGEKLRAALAYLNAMSLNIKAAVSEINVSDLNNIKVYTIDKAEIRFGDDTRIQDKITLYAEVISQKYTDKIHYIDISYKGSPVIKFLETGNPAENQ